MRIIPVIAASVLAIASPVAAAPYSASVVRTDDGYLMGNPKAPVKLVVLSAYGCPHCRILDDVMMSPLRRDWIDTGKVSLRYVPYGMFPTDVPSLFLSECGPASGFFDRSARIFRLQPQITSNFSRSSQVDRDRVAGGPAASVPAALADLSGMGPIAPKVGVASGSYRQCLSNPAIRETVSKRQKLIEARYKFPGTPAIWINGKATGTGSSWPKLEAMLRNASR